MTAHGGARPAPTALVVSASLADDAALRAGLAAAERSGAEWLTLLEPGEASEPDAAALAAPALPLFDAVFGALQTPDGFWRPSRLAFEAPERLAHALLHWWVGPPRFLRTRTLARLLADAPAGEAPVDRLFRLWNTARCIKLAAPLARAERAPEVGDPQVRAAVLERLDREPAFFAVPDGASRWLLPYTGRNPGIERDATRGLFFEAAELECLRERVGAGARIVDIGANTGNHAVFFAGPMRAEAVVAFEPLPAAAAVLRRTIAANRLGNIDLSRVETGIGASPARMRAVLSEGGGLGSTRLVPDPAGSIRVEPLDAALADFQPDLVKIDVEGMELDVLAGAGELLRRSRPLVFIEIANRNTSRFLDWLELAGYRIERIFSDKGHANYLIAPR